MKKCKCDRCGRIRDLFQYTFFDTEAGVLEVPKDNGTGASPRYTIERIEKDDSRGLCEECAVEINKRSYDVAHPHL